VFDGKRPGRGRAGIRELGRQKSSGDLSLKDSLPLYAVRDLHKALIVPSASGSRLYRRFPDIRSDSCEG
jgi:hypothetical protein